MKKRTLFSPFLAVLLASCVGVNQHAYFQSPDAITPYTESVAFYQQKVEESRGDEALRYRLRETGRLLHDGMRERARQQLSEMKSLPPALFDEKVLLETKLALLGHAPEKALKSIARISEPESLSPDLKRFYHTLLADAYQLQGNYLNSASERIQLDALLSSPATQMVNRREIWHTISRLPIDKEEAAAIDADPELKPWLSLNLIARQYRDEGIEMLQAIKTWVETNKRSIARSILEGESVKSEEDLINAPKKIALLLPLTGPLKGPGQAIRDGFMARYYLLGKQRPQVRFYDTYDNNVVGLYEKALKEGADFVVGPLSKQNVEALRHTDIDVPTIALNETEKKMPKSFYQFALSPQDEAMQVANKAFDTGLRRALVIAPQGSWGEPIAKAFMSQWEKRGGQTVAKVYFDKKNNMNESIKSILNVSDSEARDSLLKKSLNIKTKFIPRRRQDIDMIFLLAYPQKARQIRPLLRYYYAGDLPIYSTSLVYAGKPNPHADVDLNGVIFAEMPWLLDNRSKLRQTRWPEQLNSYNRLYAIGQDSFLLTQQLNQLLLFPLMGLNDNTGILYIDELGKIRRQMAWATFRRGVPYRTI